MEETGTANEWGYGQSNTLVGNKVSQPNAFKPLWRWAASAKCPGPPIRWFCQEQSTIGGPVRDIVRHVLAGMTADERVEAAEELRRMVAADRAAAADREVVLMFTKKWSE